MRRCAHDWRVATLAALGVVVLATAPEAMAAPESSQADAEPVGGSLALAGPDAAPGSTDWQLVGGIASWAAGMGLVVAFNYGFFRLRDANADEGFVAYRAGVPEGQSSCDRADQGVVVSVPGASSPSEAASLCDEMSAMEVLQAVTLPAGLVLGVLGAVLIGTSETVDPTAVASLPTVHVAVGPASALVLVGHAF